MFRAFGLLVLVGAAVGVPIAPKPAEYVEGEYVMSLRGSISDAQHDELVARFGGKKHKIGKFRAMSAKLGAAELQAMTQLDHLVEVIEHNGIVRATDDILPCDVTSPVDTGYWGLVRTTVESAAEVDSYEFKHNAGWGMGVDAYILDTGIHCEHPDLAGRCESGENFVGGNPGTDDVQGHGTHCAGTVGGTLSGISKSVNLIAVKVLNDFGSGTVAGIVEGLQWTVDQKNIRRRPGIASMSLGGGFNRAMNDAATAAFDNGVHVVVAAGNDNGDACLTSPAGAERITCVGATTIDRSGPPVDMKASFSAWGTCVDIFGPGVNVRSSTPPSSYALYSGTSMACPHVAGVLAAYLTTNPTASPAEAKQAIIDAAMAVDIQDRRAGSPDRMLHISC